MIDLGFLTGCPFDLHWQISLPPVMWHVMWPVTEARAWLWLCDITVTRQLRNICVGIDSYPINPIVVVYVYVIWTFMVKTWQDWHWVQLSLSSDRPLSRWVKPKLTSLHDARVPFGTDVPWGHRKIFIQRHKWDHPSDWNYAPFSKWPPKSNNLAYLHF